MEITFDGSQVLKSINEKILKAKNPKPLLEEIGEDMKTKVAFRFRQQKDPEGQKWTPLAQATLRARKNRKRKPSSSTKILEDNRELRLSLMGYTIIRSSVWVGSNLKYAKRQNYEDWGGKKRPRSFLGFSKNQNSLYRKMIRDYYK